MLLAGLALAQQVDYSDTTTFSFTELHLAGGGLPPYVEVHNHGKHWRQAYTWHLVQLVPGQQVRYLAYFGPNRFVPPGGFLLFTPEKKQLQAMRPDLDSSLIIALDAGARLLPDSMRLAVMSQEGELIDWLHYRAAWHTAANPSGIALEKKQPQLPSNQASSWHSASSLGSTGSPLAPNATGPTLASLQVQPSQVVAMPCQGQPATLLLQAPTAIASVQATVLGPSGQVVHTQQALPGTLSYTLIWEGRGSNGSELPPGGYTLLLQAQLASGESTSTRTQLGLAPCR